MCMFVMLSSVIWCLAVTSCLCDADSFSVSLQTLPSACEEGCTALKQHSQHLHVIVCFCRVLSHLYLTLSPLQPLPIKSPLVYVYVHRVS